MSTCLVWHVACPHVIATWSKSRKGKKPYLYQPTSQLSPYPLCTVRACMQSSMVCGFFYSWLCALLIHKFLPPPALLDITYKQCIIFAWFLGSPLYQMQIFQMFACIFLVTDNSRIVKFYVFKERLAAQQEFLKIDPPLGLAEIRTLAILASWKKMFL